MYLLVEDCLDLVAEWLPVRNDHLVLTALGEQHSAILQDPDIAMHYCHLPSDVVIQIVTWTRPGVDRVKPKNLIWATI